MTGLGPGAENITCACRLSPCPGLSVLTQCLSLRSGGRGNGANTQGEAEGPEVSASRLSRHSETGYFLLQSQQNTSLSPKDQEM